MDPFFTPKMRKMEHGSRSRWSRRSPGNEITSGCLEPPALNRPFEIASGPILWLAGAPEMEPPAAAWSLLSLTDRLRLPLCLYFGWLLLWGHLRRDENDFDPFFTPKMCKMEHGSRSRWSPGNATTGGCEKPRFTRAGGQDYVSS